MPSSALILIFLKFSPCILIALIFYANFLNFLRKNFQKKIVKTVKRDCFIIMPQDHTPAHSKNTATDLTNSTQLSRLNLDHPPVMAKDRHFLKQLDKRLRALQRLDNPSEKSIKEAQKLAQTLAKKWEESKRVAQDRAQSVPVIELNESLPVSGQAQVLIEAIQNHQVIIVAGETGSGKTTQLPKIALLAGRGITGQIGHTQPRRLAARSVANRIAEELGEPLGQTVSFKIRFTEQGSPKSLIKLMTDGILLAELAHDRFLTHYDTLIIDEAHERSLNIDFILGYLKQLLPKRPDLKVIITSATLDTERFSQYFALPDRSNRSKKTDQPHLPAPVFVVEGRSYPVEVRYRPLTEDPVGGSEDDAFDDFEDNLPKAVLAAVEECFADADQKGHPDQADILIFAATEAEIYDLQEVLTAHAPKHTQILPLFARQSYAEQQRIFQPDGGRRIIIATNVAETALTVPNIRYVIDLGFARISRYSYRSRVQRLPIEAISQAAANQRAGRCGRIGAGVCIRLYSEADFLARPEFTEPEILRTNLASVILQMASLRLGNVADFDFIQPPDSRLIKDGYKLLHELGALDSQNASQTKHSNTLANPLTQIGRQMAKMPIDPRLARMLIAGNEFDCLKEMLIIVSALAVQDPRERPINKTTQADQKHALFRQENSDFLFYLSLWQAIFGVNEAGEKLSGNGRKQFAKKHYLSFPRLREWQKTHSQLTQMIEQFSWKNVDELTADLTQEEMIVADFDFEIFNRLSTKKGNLPHSSQPKIHSKNGNVNPDYYKKYEKAVKYANLHRALLTGLLSFIAHKTEKRGEYLGARQNHAKIFPASSVFKSQPPWVMAFEIVETSQVFMRTLAKIEPEWILSAAGDLLKYHYFEPHWSKKSGRVRAYAQISLFGLIVVGKQLVNYENINATQAREIFIRDALLTGQLGINAPFLQHNLAKIEQVARIEDKLRRRDLLVDEEVLYQFYEDKIPPHIASRKAFEDWRSEIESQDPKFLFLTDQDVLTDTAPTTRAFPEEWRLGSLKLPLSYVFDPASEDDGVSIRVPLEALPQLDAVELLWGIAGWRFELVLQLLKTLPKDIRRQIVPIPDTAKILYDELEHPHQQGLLKQLCQALARRGVMGVEPKDFQPQNIDRYLQPQICVMDDKNRLIEKGRDLTTLQIRHAKTTEQAISTQQGIYTDFPEHFQFIRHRKTAGVSMVQYAALVPDDKEQAVFIQQYTDLKSALKAHRKGVLTLIKNQLGAKQKQLTSQIDKAFKMAFAPLGDLEALKKRLIDATLDATLIEYGVAFESHLPKNQLTNLDPRWIETIPLTQTDYQATADTVLKHFLSLGQNTLATLKKIYTQWQTIRQNLLMLDREIFEESIEDIEDQLDDLHLADFIYRMDYHDWQEYPRYLEALNIRLERLPNNLDKDLEAVSQLDLHMERLAGRADDEKIKTYRWLVEEFRIQLFAQPMKSKSPVSAKRLEKIWQQIH